MMCRTLSRRNNMKALKCLSLSILGGLLLGSGVLFLNNKNKMKPLIADTSTDMDAITPDNGEQLDKANMIYDDFSSGFNTDFWVTSKKAWGNGNVSLNSGVVPENVYYNSEEDKIIFRALGDYYQDNDFNYNLQDIYGYAHDDKTGGGRVYSIDGTRTGGCIKTRNAYGPGRFEARFKAAPIEGVCTAFWTFNYGTKIYDDKDKLIAHNNYSEIDFELPTYTSSDNKDDLSFDHVIYTTYQTEAEYTSQHLAAPTYLNDGEFHTYCIDWYYSNNTKKVNWFIDGIKVATCSTNVSTNVGRVTLGVWIPGNSSFCGIPNFDKAYMELDYFKYTPYKNQIHTTVVDELKDYSTSYRTLNSSPKDEFVPNGSFDFGLPSHFITQGDVEASKSYNYSGANSYGIKIAGAGGSGESRIQYTQPNVRGISKLEYSFMYKGYGSTRFNSGDTQVLNSHTLASRNEWAEYKTTINLNESNKTFTLYIVSESNDFGFFVDDIKVTFVEEIPEPPEPIEGISSYSFFTKNNGQTPGGSSIERTVTPNNDGYTWKINSGKYYVGSKDTFNTLYVKPEETVMSSTNGYYYPFKKCLSSNGFVDTDKVALLAMEFDVINLTDIEIDLYSYSGVSGRSIYTLCSIDQGASWNLINTQALSGSVASDENFRYDYKLTIPNAYIGHTVRLAFVGNYGNGSDGYRFAGVIINNFQNFKDKLDGATCNLDENSQAFLAHQYANLSASELALLSSTQMKYYEQSYAEGYNYLLNRWSNSGNGSIKIDFIKENNIVIILSTMFSVIALISFGYCVYRKRIKN